VVWADALLARTSGYDPWLGPTVIVTGIAAALVLFLSMTRRLRLRGLAVAAGVVAAVSVLAGPAAYSLTSLGTVTGIIARAGPTSGTGWGRPTTVSQGLIDYLERHQGTATYLVAVDGSEAAASFILQSGRPVIAMGGFTGLDPAPTLKDFEHLVTTGGVHYVYILGSTGGTGGRETTTAAVEAWVEKHGTVVPSAAYGGGSGDRTLYDVSSSAAAR